MISRRLPIYLAVRIGFALFAGLLSLWSSRTIYLSTTTGADENSYLFQAYQFSEGHVARPVLALKEPFRQEMIIHDDRAGWVSRYPPGHPLWLMPGVWLGDPSLMIALAAALGMFFSCAAARILGVAEPFVAVPLLCSPYYGFMYGTLLGHTSGFMAVAFMAWAYLKWRRGGSPGYVAMAGLAWSFLFLNRTYTALLMAIPFGIDALQFVWHARSRHALYGAALFAMTACVGIVGYLGYNEIVTGHPLATTYLHYAPSETLGFGPRRTEGKVVYHSLAKGVEQLVSNLKRLDRWLFGFHGSLVFWGALVAVGWTRRVSGVFLAATVFVPLGYVYFWYPGVQNAGGPVYYFDSLPLWILLGSLGLQRVWNRLAIWPRARLTGFLLVGLALASASIQHTLREQPKRVAAQMAKRELADVIQTAPSNALIFLEDFKDPHWGEIALNLRGLESDPLLLLSMYSGNPMAMRMFSDRPAYIIQGQDRPFHLQPLTSPDRILVGRDARNTHRRTGANRAFDPASSEKWRVAEEAIDREGLMVLGLSLPLAKGRYRATFHGRAEGIDPAQPSRLEVWIKRGPMLAQVPVVGALSMDALAFTVEITNRVTLVEPRVYFGGSGTVAVRRITFEEER